MLRTVFMIGLFAMIGLFILKLAFGILPVFFGLILGLLFWAVRLAIFGAVLYFAIRIFAPDTARKLRERFSGSST